MQLNRWRIYREGARMSKKIGRKKSNKQTNKHWIGFHNFTEFFFWMCEIKQTPKKTSTNLTFGNVMHTAHSLFLSQKIKKKTERKYLKKILVAKQPNNNSFCSIVHFAFLSLSRFVLQLSRTLSFSMPN